MATVRETLAADMAALETKYQTEKAALQVKMAAEESVLAKDWETFKAEVISWYDHITKKAPPAA